MSDEMRGDGHLNIIRLNMETIVDLLKGKDLSYTVVLKDGSHQTILFRPPLGGRFMTYEEIRKLEREAYSYARYSDEVCELERGLRENPPYVEEVEKNG